MNLHRRHCLQRAAALALGPAAAALAGCERPVLRSFKSVDITGVDYGRSLALPDAQGQTRQLAEFKGKVVVLFFGYTQCPDVCPTTLAELAQAKKLLGADGARVQGVFVSIDPERDTPEVLRAYASSFDPTLVALRGSLEQTAQVAKEFKVLYSKVPGKSPGSYTMDHTAASFVFDPEGKLRLYVRYGSGPEVLAHDIRQLLS